MTDLTPEVAIEPHDVGAETLSSPTLEKFTPEQVTGAFSSCFDSFDSAPETSLQPQELADRDLLREVKSKTIDLGKKFYLNKFNGSDGTKFSQREHLPIETLLKFAEKRLEDPSLTDEERGVLKENIHILLVHSKTYADIRGRITPDGQKYSARIHQETERITADPRLGGVDPEELQTRRRELVIPPKRKDKTPPPPVPDPPDPIEPVPDPDPDPPEDPPDDPIEPPPIGVIRREFYFVNRTVDPRKRAAENAELAVREEQRRGSMLNPKNWIRKTKMRVGEEYYRQQYMQRGVEAMTEHNNSYLQMDLVKNAAIQADTGRDREREAGLSKIEQLRIQQEIGLELEGQIIREATGDLKTHILDQIIKPAIEGGIADIAEAQRKLREFISSHQDAPEIQEVFGKNTTEYGVMADYFATDLLEMARLVKEDIDANKYALDQLDRYVDVKLAYTDWAAEGRAKFTAVDKAVAWAESHGWKGRVINPATVGAAFSIGVYSTLRAASIGGKAAAVAVPGAGALSGALFAAARRSHDLKVDRASHGVEIAYNAGSTQGLKRREQMQKLSYETASFDDLIVGGRERSAMGDARGINELLMLDLTQPVNQEALTRRTTEILSRLDYSANQSADLITFTSRETVEQNRLGLIKHVVEARQKLRDSGMTDADITTLETRLRGDWTRQLTQNKDQQDRAFRNYRLRSSLMSGIYGGATGLVLGLGVQQGLELASEHTPAGSVLEKVFPGGKKDGTNVQESLQRDGKITLGDHEMFVNGNGQLEVVGADGEGVILDGASINPQGEITLSGTPLPASVVELLDDNGFTIDQEVQSSTKALLEPGAVLTSQEINGRTISIPEGTQLVQDSLDPSKWDLVVTSDPSIHLAENIGFDADGKLFFDAASSKPELISIITNEQTVMDEVEKTVTITGPEGVIPKEGTPIHHREWYAYDTPYSERNELTAYNSVFTASNGDKGVVWDMSAMTLGYQSGLNPNPIDVQRVIQDGQAGFAFSFADTQGAPIWVSDLSDGVADGKITMDPTSTALINPADPGSMTVGELSKIVLNQSALRDIPDGSLASELTNRREVFNLGSGDRLGFIEAGRMIETNEGRVLQTFATAAGTGPAPETITTVEFVPTKIYDHEIKLTGPLTTTDEQLITTILPSPGESGSDIPLIPIPMSPRFPLERLSPPVTIPPPYYPFVYSPIAGGAMGIDESGRAIRRYDEHGSAIYNVPINDSEKWVATRSQRLKDNPQAVLNQQTEINDYFERLGEGRNERIDKLEQQIETPLHSDTRGIICIPAAAALETDNIQPTLELLTQQSNVSASQYEVILYLNWMNGADMEKVQHSIDIAKQFQLNHPDFPFRFITEELQRETFTIGDVMKTVNDVALKRIQNADIDKDVILTVLPADIKGLSRRFTEGLIKNADGSKDIYTSPIEFGTMFYKDYPGFHVAMRALENLIRISEQAYPAPIFTAGSGLQKRASMLAAVGGYDETAKVGEDADIGAKVVAARLGGRNEYTKEEFPVGRSFLTWNEVDPARLLDCYRNGKTVLAAWSDFSEGGYKARPLNPTSTSESLDAEWADILGRIESQLTVLNASYTSSLTTRAFNLALGYTKNTDGSDSPAWIKNPDGTISLTDAGKSKLKQALLDYKNQEKYNARYRPFINSGNPSRGVKPDMPTPRTSPTPLTPTTPPPAPATAPLSTFDSAVSIPDTFSSSTESMRPETKEDILNHLRISGGSFGGKMLTAETLRTERLEPFYRTEIAGIPMYFSNTFTVSGGRSAVIAYTKKDGTYTPRTFYRSNSQGVWRYLPAYTRGADGTIDWYHKGYGEESLTLPFELQRTLATIDTDPARRISVSDSEFIFAGTASEKRHLTPDMTFVRDTEFTPVRIDGTYSTTGNKLSPENVRPADLLDNPDFDHPKTSWESSTRLYGLVQYETFPSKNGKYTYTFCRNNEGKIWIGGVEGDDAIGGTGLRKKWIQAGDLATPAYEYSSQAGRYGNIRDRKPGGYVDMYENYVSKIPMIEEYSHLKSADPVTDTPLSVPTPASNPESSTLTPEPAIPLPTLEEYELMEIGSVFKTENGNTCRVNSVSTKPDGKKVFRYEIIEGPMKGQGGMSMGAEILKDKRAIILESETPVPEPEETPVPDTKTAIEKIQDKLSGETSPTSRFEMTPTDLAQYINTLPLPGGARMEDVSIAIAGGRVQFAGKISKLGTSRFNAELGIDPSGKISVLNKNIHYALTHRSKKKEIEEGIANVNDEITKALNNKLPIGWKVNGFGLSGGGIEITFGKTP